MKIECLNGFELMTGEEIVLAISEEFSIDCERVRNLLKKAFSLARIPAKKACWQLKTTDNDATVVTEAKACRLALGPAGVSLVSGIRENILEIVAVVPRQHFSIHDEMGGLKVKTSPYGRNITGHYLAPSGGGAS